MDNINSNLKTIVSSLNEIKAVNTKEDSNKLLKLVEKAKKLYDIKDSDGSKLNEDDYEKIFTLTLRYLKKIKERIKNIIEKTIASRLVNDGVSTTLWNWLTWSTSFSSETKSKGIYKDGSVDMEKLIEKEDELKLHDSFFTKKLCGELVDLYKQCNETIKKIMDKDSNKIIRQLEETTFKEKSEDMISKSESQSNKANKLKQADLSEQKQNFLEKLKNKKKKAMNKKTFENIILEKLNISKIASEMSKKFDSKGVSVKVESIKNKAIKIMNEKIHSKDTFYLSDIDDTKKEIEENCDCDKIYNLVIKDSFYQEKVKEIKKVYENVSDIESKIKKCIYKSIAELLVESRDLVNENEINEIIKSLDLYIDL